MFSLMLDPRFKTFQLATSLINHEPRKAIVKKYDKINLFLCFLSVIIICILWLNLKESVFDQRVEEDNNLDIFETTIGTIDLTMELINIEFLIFKCYQVDIKDFKCPLQWWENHGTAS
jgi:hypothetical protein